MTLLELLIVIAVFSIMSAVAYSGLQSTLKTGENFSASMKDLEAVQMSLTLFQRDIMQLSPRAIRDAYGDNEAAVLLFNGQELVFTRAGNFSSLKLDHTELTRVAYSLQDKQLIRSHWRRLDSIQGDRPLRASLLSKISNLQIRVLDMNNSWHLDWPLSDNAKIRAVELTLELEGWGEIRRLFPVPG
ncbi:MAG: type II secretion system minor pseudopilin GspJ [Lysobacterales bacterium]